jgi:putative toxin-antitoxin system antitoxin component (TIGR02293 family)
MIVKEPKPLNLNSLDLGNSQGEKVFHLLFGEHNQNDWSSFDTNYVIIDCLRAGLPKQIVHNILEKTAVTKMQLSNIIHVSYRQLNRYEADDKLSAEQSNFLYEFARLYVRTTDILGDASTADEWLHRSNVALRGENPIEILDTIEGFRMVEDLLSQIEYGFYS